MAKSPSAIIETPPAWIQASKRQTEEMIYEIPTCMQQLQLERSHFSAVQDASASSFLSWGSPSFSEHHAVLWLAGEDAHSLWIFCSDPDIFSLKLMSDRKSQFPLSHSLCRSLMNVREMRMDWLLPRTLQVHATWRHTLMSRGHEVPLWQIDLFSFFFLTEEITLSNGKLINCPRCHIYNVPPLNFHGIFLLPLSLWRPLA